MMDERVLMSTEQVLNVMLKALHDAQMQTLAYKAEVDRLRAEIERMKEANNG